MTMSPSMCCFSVETSLSTSPLRTVELSQVGLARVADTTYLGRLFSLSASSPLRDGHRAASLASPPRLEEQPVSFAGPPGVIVDGFYEVFVDGHGLLFLLIGVVSYRRRRRRGW